MASADFTDGFAQRYPARALVVHRRGRIARGGSLIDDAPGLSNEAAGDRPAEHVVIDAAALRIIVDEPGLRFAVYVEPADLATVPIHEVALSATAGGAASGVSLLPGAPIRIVSRGPAWAEVALDGTGLAASGIVPTSAFGAVYMPIHRAPDPAPANAATIRPGAALFDQPVGEPAGKPIARAARPLAASLGDTRSGFVAVEIEGSAPGRETEAAYRVHGWIRSTDVIASGDFEDEVFGTTGDLFGSPHSVLIPAGTQLYTAPDGELVGITLDGAAASPGERRDGWQALSFATTWGALAVWAKQ